MTSRLECWSQNRQLLPGNSSVNTDLWQWIHTNSRRTIVCCVFYAVHVISNTQYVVISSSQNFLYLNYTWMHKTVLLDPPSETINSKSIKQILQRILMKLTCQILDTSEHISTTAHTFWYSMQLLNKMVMWPFLLTLFHAISLSGGFLKRKAY